MTFFTTKSISRLLALIAFVPTFAFAQLTINNAENFNVGNVLRFVECNTTGVQPGASGAGVNWDFSNLVANGDTMTERMVAPSSTSYAAQFPAANLVEKYSDGTFVFVNKMTSQSWLVGYVDSIANIVISYPDAVLIGQRPISYNDMLGNTYSAFTTSPGYSAHGSGTVAIAADGYGTLQLPTGTFNNVLRLHISEVQVDTAVGIGTYTTTHVETYVWFDDAHASALLKIDSFNTSGVFSEKTVEYLHEELTSNHAPDLSSFQFNASFVGNDLIVFGNGLQENVVVEVYDAVGKAVAAEEQNAQSRFRILTSTKALPNGLYCVALKQNGNTIGFAKAVKAQ